ncbi:hypothetical protein E2979_01325 (plasmid) [Paracoccus yeei]
MLRRPVESAQFTSLAWTDRLKRVGTRISMDGKGRCIDNVFIERLWRSLKYECVYLHAWETGLQARQPSATGSHSTTTGGLIPPMAGSRPPWSTSIASKPISRRRQ